MGGQPINVSQRDLHPQAALLLPAAVHAGDQHSFRGAIPNSHSNFVLSLLQCESYSATKNVPVFQFRHQTTNDIVLKAFLDCASALITQIA